MHMADALISVPVGVTFWGISGVAASYASSRLKKELDEEKIIPLMGVAGAFVFALQMVNFAIPGTGSSGHFAGGFLLALLLGRHAAFLVMSSVLLVQALFFADGGLLALGCNIFNLAFIPSYIVYPLFRNIIDKNESKTAIWSGAFLSLCLGAVMVSMQTGISGIAELPFSKMLLLMLGVHLLIAVIEGVITVGSYIFIKRYSLQTELNNEKRKLKPYFSILSVSLIIAAVFSLFASSKPDGLEWSVYNIMGGAEEPHSLTGYFHNLLAYVQEKIAFLPDYSFAGGSGQWGTSVAGIVGAIIVIILASSLGYIIRKANKN
ncbi:MAG: cobalamin biosynthesis protein CbiM [Flexistipes sinusarabici]|uniref:Cobalamin biosynthesis protein CbiM n=2 Tax=Flexistipes sinusarabici TaxID=2352 RepID=A0A5D0MLD4_FLESI|nr:MAG: cobalamin biosynthesis protein CbiM [Flexistipes sinusarabici]